MLNIHFHQIVSEQSTFIQQNRHAEMKGMNGVLGHDSALVKLYWAVDNLG